MKHLLGREYIAGMVLDKAIEARLAAGNTQGHAHGQRDEDRPG
jgi:hypothetical protein